MDLSAGRRVAFAEVCETCGTDLHSCLHCAHHDPGAYNACREPGAERVSDRERANRCEWFQPGTGPSGSEPDDRERARARLDALFRK